MGETFYDVFELNRNCTDEEIKQAYHRLAKLHHPDMGGDSNTFIKIQEAYDLLSTQRGEYDLALDILYPERKIELPKKVDANNLFYLPPDYFKYPPHVYAAMKEYEGYTWQIKYPKVLTLSNGIYKIDYE